jgi:hypothetical protein
MGKNLVKFKEWDCVLVYGNYANKRTAITLIEEATGDAVATATLNIDYVKLADDEIIIKDYSENEGMYEALLKSGIIGPIKRKVPLRHTYALVCDLLWTVEKIKNQKS